MGYTQVTIEERCEIARLRAAGTSIRQVAAGLDRALVDGCSGAEAQRFTHHGLPAVVRAGAVPRASLVRFPVGAGYGSACLRSNASVGGGRRSRYAGIWRGGRAERSSPTRASTGSSTPRKRGTKTTAGGSICRRRSGNAAGVCAKGAVRSPSSSSVTRSPSARPLLQTGRPSATGRLT